MKILHTVQGYYPYIGGSEELVRKVSEEMVRLGHDVTVFTSVNPARTYECLNGVKLRQFDLSGNSVRGIKGNAQAYVDAVVGGDFDIMMNYAAQTWATDLLLPHLGKMPFKKVLAPCGYSGLFNDSYQSYFEALPQFLRQYDHLIYHSATYQDKKFGDRHAINHATVVSNFAEGAEFESNTIDFRKKYGITSRYLMLTVANHYRDKGHGFVIDAFLKADIPDAMLVIIGNPTNKMKLYSDCFYECKMRELLSAGRIRMLSQVPREDVVAAYKAADLFLFGSKVECSPLVIFEAMASKTPWISTDVGNVAEIRHGELVGSTSEMALQIRAMICNESMRLEKACAVHSEWNEKYEFRKIVRQYLNVYQNTFTS